MAGLQLVAAHLGQGGVAQLSKLLLAHLHDGSRALGATAQLVAVEAGAREGRRCLGHSACGLGGCVALALPLDVQLNQAYA